MDKRIFAIHSNKLEINILTNMNKEEKQSCYSILVVKGLIEHESISLFPISND